MRRTGGQAALIRLIASVKDQGCRVPGMRLRLVALRARFSFRRYNARIGSLDPAWAARGSKRAVKEKLREAQGKAKNTTIVTSGTCERRETGRVLGAHVEPVRPFSSLNLNNEPKMGQGRTASSGGPFVFSPFTS